MSTEPNTSRPRDPAFTAAFALIATAMACAVVVLAVPRQVEPNQLPPLLLDRSEARAAIANDRARIAKAPSGARVDELYQLYLAEGEAELVGQAALSGTFSRRATIRLLASRLFDELGPQGVAALRARAVERFMHALVGQLADEKESRGLVGTFPAVLQKYGLIDAERRLLAPELAVRAMYKARWNMIFERGLVDGFEQAELQAYRGWSALHAGILDPSSRATASRELYEAHGKHSGEALAIWLFQGGMVPQALSLMRRVHEHTGSLRARNMALFMLTVEP